MTDITYAESREPSSGLSLAYAWARALCVDTFGAENVWGSVADYGHAYSLAVRAPDGTRYGWVLEHDVVTNWEDGHTEMDEDGEPQWAAPPEGWTSERISLNEMPDREDVMRRLISRVPGFPFVQFRQGGEPPPKEAEAP